MTGKVYLLHCSRMPTFSTRQAAKMLGIDPTTLSRYISAGKVPAPKSVSSGGATIHIWTEADIAHVRRLLPKIKNGRKTRYKKQREEEKKQVRKKTES